MPAKGARLQTKFGLRPTDPGKGLSDPSVRRTPRTPLAADAGPLTHGRASAAVEVRDVSHTYRDRDNRRHRGGRGNGYGSDSAGEVHALDAMTVHAAEHELLAIVGPSGCGKTTLLELICGLQRPDSGTVECLPAALMPQRDLLLPWLTALDNAALALRIGHEPRARARTRAAALFEELGLAGFEQARPHELSGGMRQRVAFVRTLLSGKPLLCLDEPFGALDAITRAEMQTWLTDALAREPRTVVLVTHDVEEAVVLADRVAVVSARPGRVVRELEVGLAPPRSRTDPEVLALREQALRALADSRPRPSGTLERANARDGAGR
jgi:ABC-type nitrate/sulfonate/bicarbonate transport system ATPase subunit